MKAAIVVLSDPNHAAEEATGRVFNALAAAYDFKQHGDEVAILFQGAGTRWIAKLAQAGHPVHELYESVKDKVADVSCGCANVFGAAEEAQQHGIKMLTDNPVPNTPGLPSLRALTEQGYSIFTF